MIITRVDVCGSSMIDEAKLDRFYSGVPAAHLERFRHFLRTHKMKKIEVTGSEVPYYSCGRGPKTLLGFCGVHSTPYTAWETILAFEDDYRVIVIDISGFDTVSGQAKGIDLVLEEEGVEQVILLGQSLAGIVSQIYFKCRSERVDGMILINTPALKKGDSRSFNLAMLGLIPAFVLKALLKYRFGSYYKKAMGHPEAEGGCRFGLAHLDDVMANHFTKKKVLNILRVIRQFRQEGYGQDDFTGWRGRTLVVAAEDDAGFADSQWLIDHLPNSKFHTFSKGSGHIPQLVHRGELERLIRSFLADLG